MTMLILGGALALGQLLLALAAGLSLWRMLRGPRAQDRLIGLDALSVCVMLLLLVTGIRQASAFFIEAALVIGAMGFVTTVALGKFLLRGEVIE